jgi:O-antigen/teichoic acid export membrane protein
MQEPEKDVPPALPQQAVRGPALWQRARQVLGVLRLRAFDTSTADGRSLERYRRIAWTTVTGMAIRMVGSLLALFSVPIVLTYLGKERFGLWAIVTTLVAWVSLFDLGLANGLVNMLSAANGRGDRAEAGQYLSTAFVALLAMACVLALAVLFSITTIPWSTLLGANGAADESTIRWSVGAALALFVISLPFSVTQQVYAAYQRTYIWNGFVLSGSVLGFAGLLSGVWLRVSMPMLIVVNGIAGPLATIAAYAYATRKSMPWLRPAFGKVSQAALRSLLSRSIPIFMYQVGALVVNETQSILLAHRCDLAVVASFSIGMRFYLLFIAVVQIGTNSFIPALREAFDRGDRDWTSQAFARLLHVRIIVASITGLALILLGNSLLWYWLHRTDLILGKGVWTAMAFLMIGAMWGSSYAELLSIMDRLWVNVLAVFTNGALALLLTYYLSPRFQVLGAIVSLAVPTALVTVFLRICGRTFLASAGLHPEAKTVR